MYKKVKKSFKKYKAREKNWKVCKKNKVKKKERKSINQMNNKFVSYLCPEASQGQWKVRGTGNEGNTGNKGLATLGR